MPALYLLSKDGELLLKTTLNAPAIQLIPPGLKAALHILAARYIDPPPLEEWVTLTWRNGPSGNIYVTYEISLPIMSAWSYRKECAVCGSRSYLRDYEPQVRSLSEPLRARLCSRCFAYDLCWTCCFWDDTVICLSCLEEDEAKCINKYHRRRRTAVWIWHSGFYDHLGDQSGANQEEFFFPEKYWTEASLLRALSF